MTVDDVWAGARAQNAAGLERLARRIVPSVGAMVWARRIGPRLAIGWTMGVLVSMLGMYLSVWFDLPTGATIVCTFGAVLAMMALVKQAVVRLGGVVVAQTSTSTCAAR